MAALLTTTPSNSNSLSFFSKHNLAFSKPLQSSSSLFFPIQKPTKPITLIRPFSSLTDPPPDPINITDEWGEKTDPPPETVKITDEWGEKTEPEPENPNAPNVDPPKNEDEWEEEKVESGNDVALKSEEVVADDKVGDFKRCLVDSVYGTSFGFRASPEVRGEVLELVNQLEALNPTSNPVESSGLLDGNWVLVYTAFSELLPLLAAGATPLLKVEKISQSIDTSNQTIVNSTTLSNPFATFSFSATASFEVRSPSRVQVQFKEGTFEPPAIKSNVELPENVDIFGQQINLSPVRQTLNPIQDVAANISRIISGQPPLKLPIPGDRTKSWLLFTYLDYDLLISRGDGGLFVLVKEGNPLLDQFQ